MGSLRHLNKYFFKYKWRLLAGIAFVIIFNLFGVYPAQVVRHSVDEVMQSIQVYRNGGQIPGSYDLFKLFGGFFLLIFVLSVLKGIFMFFMRQTIIVVSRYIEYDLKNELYEKYQQLNTSFYRQNNTGDLMNRVSEDVGRVRMYVGPSLMYLVNLGALFVLVISTMLSINVKLTLFALLPLPFLTFSIYYVQKLIHDKSEKIQEQLSDLSTYVQESFSGIRVLKAYVREVETARLFAEASEDYKKRSMELALVQSLFFPLMVVLIGLSMILTIYVGGMEAMKGHISPGNIAEFVVYVNMLTWPVMTLGWTTSQIQRAAASQKRINEFLAIRPSITTTGGEELKEMKADVEFRDVSFTYPETGIQALKNISFQLKAGESLAITGATGSGKSTIAALLNRLYDPATGGIYLDGEALPMLQLQSIRKQIGYVPQTVFLFSDSIRNNINFGNGGLSEAAIIAAAEDAAVYDNILALPEGLDTRIGERGITLSGGQKQRISIARAIAGKPALLIFDDCLSAVDTKTEEEILNNLNRIMAGRTTLIISQRISTLKNAARILVLEEGRLIEEGSHASLLALGGTYAGLYERQLLEEAANEEV